MTDDRRAAEPYGNSLSKIEINFSIPTYWTTEQERTLHRLLDEVINKPYNQPTNGIHWVCGYGSKPRWSQEDAIFLGKTIDPDASERGEPTYDDKIFHIEICTRPFVSDGERNRVLRQEKADNGSVD